MSALAQILVEKGIPVTGSDLKGSSHLNIPLQSTMPSEGAVIYSSAIPSTHPDYLLAIKEKRLLHRSLLLRDLLSEKKGLLVAGTHGKTGTSALLAWTLMVAEQDPTYAVGGILKNTEKNGGYGEGEYFVAEADESDGSFLNFYGEGAIVTNLEKEHLDHWKTESALIQGFRSFMNNIASPNLLFYCSDDPLLNEISPKGISYGHEGDLKMVACEQNGGELQFDAEFEGHCYRKIRLPLFGRKLALNALAVFGMALKLGIPEEKIRSAFCSFKGVKRRQEWIGEKNRINIYDDYAHHPTEIMALIEGFRAVYPKNRLIALFQPHRYSRTQLLFSEFVEALQLADLALLTEIYPAGEEAIPGLSSQELARKLPNALFIGKQRLLSYLPKLLIPGDLLLTIGAGDITSFGPKILEALK